MRSVKVAATFSTIAVLWSLWSSPSLSAWLEYDRVEGSTDHEAIMSRQLIVTLVILACGLAARKENHDDDTANGIGGDGPNRDRQVAGSLGLGLCPWPSDWDRVAT